MKKLVVGNKNREPWNVNRAERETRFAIHDSRFSGRREIRWCRSEAVIEPA